jgi:hypothetical protein
MGEIAYRDSVLLLLEALMDPETHPLHIYTLELTLSNKERSSLQRTLSRRGLRHGLCCLAAPLSRALL